MKGTSKISGIFRRTLNMAKVNLRQIRLSHVLESYTTQFYQNPKVKQDMKELSKLFQSIELLSLKKRLLKVKRKWVAQKTSCN